MWSPGTSRVVTCQKGSVRSSRVEFLLCVCVYSEFVHGLCIKYTTTSQTKRAVFTTYCPRRVLAQKPKLEEALIGPPAYKECEILV